MSIDLSSYLRRIPALAHVDPSDCQRLGGLTNLNFLVPAAGERFVLRIPGEGTDQYINRTHEEIAARSAAAVDVNVEVVFFDSTDGLMVTRFADGATTMTAASFRDLSAVTRAASAFRELHDRATPFANDFTLFPMIDGYRRLLTDKGSALPDGYDDVQKAAETVRDALEAHPVKLVASHCDPLCENFLDTGARMYLIDYEYAGNNDPMWDLGDLSVEADFDARQDEVLLSAYFDSDPPAQYVGRMVAYKALCDLLWTLWGVLQHVNDNRADDFWSYAVGRFERCRTLMATDGFQKAVSDIGG